MHKGNVFGNIFFTLQGTGLLCALFKKISKIVEFSLWSKQCFATSLNYTFFWILAQYEPRRHIHCIKFFSWQIWSALYIMSLYSVVLFHDFNKAFPQQKVNMTSSVSHLQHSNEGGIEANSVQFYQFCPHYCLHLNVENDSLTGHFDFLLRRCLIKVL